jgi:hypothetical protein
MSVSSYTAPEGYDELLPEDEICASLMAKDKELWIVRLPNSVKPAQLNGAKVKLSGDSRAAGKVSVGEQDYEIQTAEATEFKNFVSVFSSENSLVIGKPFTREINVVAATVSDSSGGKKPKQTLHFWDAGYSAVAQRTGLRVRSMPAGAGHLAPVTKTKETKKRKQTETPEKKEKGEKKAKKEKKEKKEKKKKKKKTSA